MITVVTILQLVTATEIGESGAEKTPEKMIQEDETLIRIAITSSRKTEVWIVKPKAQTTEGTSNSTV